METKSADNSEKTEPVLPSHNGEIRASSSSPTDRVADQFEDNSNVPKLNPFKLFWLFLTRFGIFAWGGPVAQIALLKEELVTKEKWITLPRFNRVFAVYQILPGPEAAELCMFFGCLSGGRLGGIAAGMGFILPGFLLMLLASYLYIIIGFGNRYVNASFRALQPMVAAMMFKAIHKISEHALLSHETKKPNPWLIGYALFTALNSALRINWFISLGVYGLIHMAVSRRLFIIAGILFALQYVGYGLYVHFKGIPSPLSIALGIAPKPDVGHLFGLGLVSGSLSFGGAFTAIPFIQAEAVVRGGWMPQQVFIDCIAIGNILPAPLVIFATFVGFQGGNVYGGLGYAFAGAVVITIGMFFPCFLFVIAGHHILERLVRNKFLAAFFDGLCGSVVGIIAIVAFQILGASINFQGYGSNLSTDQRITIASQNSLAAVVFVLALAVLYSFGNRYTVILLVFSGALAGQFIFV
ncbi:chromate transporter [Serendipita vermifera]|nr:chromate transporter [Serendipita vermifera]